MIQQTSLQAYSGILPELGERQMQVYKLFLTFTTLYDQEIAEHLHLHINCVTPRRGELEEKGLIEFVGITKSRFTGKSVRVYKIRR